MNRFTRGAAVLLSAGLLAGSMATAASAGTSGGPSPGVPSQPLQHKNHGLRPQFFDIVNITKGHGDKVVFQSSVVRAFGPIYGVGTDEQVSNTLDVFHFDKGSVNVYHTDVSDAQPQFGDHCTFTLKASGNWAVIGGTMKYTRAFGFGGFKLEVFGVLQSWRDKWGHVKCDMNQNDPPAFEKDHVFAWGKSTLHGFFNKKDVAQVA